MSTVCGEFFHFYCLVSTDLQPFTWLHTHAYITYKYPCTAYTIKHDLLSLFHGEESVDNGNYLLKRINRLFIITHLGSGPDTIMELAINGCTSNSFIIPDAPVRAYAFGSELSSSTTWPTPGL